MSRIRWTLIIILLAAASQQSMGFAPLLVQRAGRWSNVSGRLVRWATKGTGNESFQRSLLEARLKYEGKPVATSVERVSSGSSSSTTFAFQRALLTERIVQDKAAAAAAPPLKTTKAIESVEKDATAKGTKEEAEMKVEQEARLKADESAKQQESEEATTQAIRAEEEARSEALRTEEEARFDEMRADEEARLGKLRAAENAIVAEKAKADAEAKRSQSERDANMQAEFDALVSRTQELKERVKGFRGRIKSIDLSKVLPSADDVADATSALTKFVVNPRDAANKLKVREESNSELVKVCATGAANAIVDSVGAGFELVDAVRSDQELIAVVGDALDNAGAAISAIVKTEDDNAERKTRIAILALDSLGIAAYASICGLIGYSQSGTPVFDAASKAAQGFLQAISAFASLSVRSLDVVAEGYKQGQDVAALAVREEESDAKMNEAKPVTTGESEFESASEKSRQ